MSITPNVTRQQLESWPLIALWGEMLERCIPQTPRTKSRAGAIEAILASCAPTEPGDAP